MNLTIEEVMADLEYGRAAAGRPDGATGPRGQRLERLDALPRPTAGGGTFLRAYLAARLLGAIHPRLARRWLLRLWFTPWVHPSASSSVTDLPAGASPWRHAVDGVDLHGYQAGSGGPDRTVVLLHGWSGRAADMRHLAGGLVGDGWRVVAPDLPAHGRTRGRQTDLFVLGRAVASVLADEQPAVVVAHSMGFPALMLALESGAPAPARIAAIAPGRKMMHAIDGFARRARLGTRLVAELRRGIEARYGAGVWQTLDVDRVLDGLGHDGLVIHDTGDEDVPISDARHIASAWPAARLLETSGLGHRRILRDPDVRERVLGWLRAPLTGVTDLRMGGEREPVGLRASAG